MTEKNQQEKMAAERQGGTVHQGVRESQGR